MFILPWGRLRSYQTIDPANHRMRALIEDTVEHDAWQLLWLPPALPYYEPAGPFAESANRGLTKRLEASPAAGLP